MRSGHWRTALLAGAAWALAQGATAGVEAAGAGAATVNVEPNPAIEGDTVTVQNGDDDASRCEDPSPVPHVFALVTGKVLSDDQSVGRRIGVRADEAGNWQTEIANLPAGTYTITLVCSAAIAAPPEPDGATPTAQPRFDYEPAVFVVQPGPVEPVEPPALIVPVEPTGPHQAAPTPGPAPVSATPTLTG